MYNRGMSSKASSVIETGIFARDAKDFAVFLHEAGYKKFALSIAGEFLHLYFIDPKEELYYNLQDIESAYKKAHSNVYYYDLDDNIDNDIQDIFGEDDF